MKLLASFLLLAASTGSQLIDETQTVPAGDWAYRDIQLHRQAARIVAGYEVIEGSSNVRLALMLHEDLDRMNDDLAGSIAMTDQGNRGFLNDKIRRRGDFALVLDNRDGKRPATVRLKAWLDWNGPEEKSLPPQRQLAVLVASAAVFLGIVGFSARRLLGIRKRSVRG